MAKWWLLGGVAQDLISGSTCPTICVVIGQWYSMIDAANWLLTIKVVVILPALITGEKCHELKALLCMIAPECPC